MSNQSDPRAAGGYISPLKHPKDQTWAEMMADIEYEQKLNYAKRLARHNQTG